MPLSTFTPPPVDATLHQSIFQHLKANTARLNRGNVKRMLVFINLEKYPIGDSVLFFSKIRAFKKYYHDPVIDVFCTKANYIIMQHYPFIDRFLFDMEAVDFASYDAVMHFAEQDHYLPAMLVYKMGAEQALQARFGVYNLYANYGIEKLMLFDVHREFLEYVVTDYLQERDFSGHELYISDEERAWANEWYREAGVQEGERVIIMLDSTASRHKLMRVDVYFEMLRYFMQLKNTRIVVFDPDNIGKREAYSYMLQTDNLDQFIFVKRQGLRKDICLLGGDAVHMILGPCTGLLHCAEGVYNVYEKTGRLQSGWPLMFAYVGPSEKHDLDRWFWWGDTHVEALYVEEEKQQKVVKKLTGPGNFGLHPTEFTADALIQYFVTAYGHKFKEWDMLPEDLMVR